MKYSVSIAPRAYQDIDNRLQFVSQKYPEFADYLAEDFARALRCLSFAPNRYKPGVKKGTRESLLVRNYAIVFRVDDILKTVEVLHVYHQAQER